MPSVRQLAHELERAGTDRDRLQAIADGLDELDGAAAEEFLKNLLRIHRVGNGIISGTATELNKLFDAISFLVFRAKVLAPKTDRGRYARLAKLQREIEAEAEESYERIFGLIEHNLVGLGVDQTAATFAFLLALLGRRPLKRRTALRTVDRVRDHLGKSPIQGYLLREWVDNNRDHIKRLLLREIRLSIMGDESVEELMARIEGKLERNLLRGGVLGAAILSMTGIIRTAATHVAASAAFAALAANPDITKRYKYVAVLDSRTTPICRALDGQVFEYGEGPLPPQHVNCRSSIQPVIDWGGLGLARPPVGTRPSMYGPVPANWTYQQWLRRQSKARQSSILGPARARLFRDNKATLRDMVRRDGEIVTLSELGVG